MWGEEVCIVGSASNLGAWDVCKAIPLKADLYPLWKSESLKLPTTGRIEYKYVKRKGKEIQWEDGCNRWVPSQEGAPLTVDDGIFGFIQPEPFGFYDHDDRPSLRDVSNGQKRIVVIGSSVAEGYCSWCLQGWARRLGEAVESMYGHSLINVSKCGANTQVTKDRFVSEVAPWKPDVVIIALSLGNEGLAHCPPADRHATQHRFEQGILDLSRMCSSMGAIPVLGGVYPNDHFVPETYRMLLETAHTMSTWGLPVLNWLSAVDDGQGRWKTGTSFDHAHPNNEGHRLMFESIDLSIFSLDPENGKVQLMRSRSRIDQFDSIKRKTSYSSMHPLVKASLDAEKRTKQRGYEVFNDGQGFTVIVTGKVLNLKNCTLHPYTVWGEWKELDDAISSSLAPGTYLCCDKCDVQGCRLVISQKRHIENILEVTAGTSARFQLCWTN